MRIEELNTGSYVKIPNKLETDLINVLNRFFVTDNESLENSREGLILEIQKRIRPMIANMVKRIAWLEGEAIFHEQLEKIMEEEVNRVLKEVMETVLNMRNQLIKNVTLKFPINTPTETITIPRSTSVDATNDVVNVLVNGQKQEKDENYSVTVNENNKITTIVFDDELEIGDKVELECWIYSEDLVNYKDHYNYNRNEGGTNA